MAYPAPRRLQFRRGNTAAVSAYLGYAGELIVNTDNNTLYIHDGVTVGGHAATVNTASITGNISSITNGTALFGNIIPSANVAYTLGNITHQWRSLYVSNNTIYIGGVPLSIDNNGNLSINGNAIPTVSYVNTQVANVTVDLSSYALNANVTAANVGMKGYVDSQSFYSNAKVATYLSNFDGNINGLQIDNIVDQLSFGPGESYSFLNMKNDGTETRLGNDNGNVRISAMNQVDSVAHYWNFDSHGILTIPNGGKLGGLQYADGIDLYANGSMSYSQVNYDNRNYIYVDSFVSQLQTPNVNIIADSYNQRANISVFNGSTVAYWNFYANGEMEFPDNSKQTTAYSNAAVSTYLSSATQQTFGDSVTITGNLIVQGNIFLNGNVNTLDTNNLVINDNIIYLANANPSNSLDIGFVGHFIDPITGYQHTGLVRQASTNTWKLFSNIAQEPTGTVNFTDVIYDNIQVGDITSPTITLLNANASAQQTLISSLQSNAASQQTEIASLQSNAVSQQTTINTLLANAATQSDLIIQTNANITQANVGMKGYVDNAVATIVIPVTYSNVNVQAYTETMGFKNYSNVNVAAYLATATITTTGNITAAYLTGNINITSNITGTSPNVTLQAGLFNSVFDNLGNVTVPRLFTSGNIQTAGYLFGNGAFLTGVVTGSSYSNVQAQTYLTGYVGDIIPVSAYSNNLGNLARPWGNFVTYNMELAGGYLKTGGTGGISGQVLKSTGTSNPPAWSNIADVISGSGAQITVSNLKLAPSGNIVFADGTVQTTAASGGSNYGNGNVASYLITNAYINSNSAYGNGNVTSYLPTHSGNVGVNNLIGITPNVTLVSNSYSTTFDIYGNVAFGNVLYPVQTFTTGNVSTASFLIGSRLRVTDTRDNAFNSDNAVYVAGGATINGNIAGGGRIVACSFASSDNINSGAIQTNGGIGAWGNLNLGGQATVAGNVTVNGTAGITMPNRPAFRVNGTGSMPQTTSNVNLKGSILSTVFNQGSYFDATTGKFTAPVAGIYEVSLVARVNTNSTSQIAVLKNGLNSSGNIVCFWEADASTGTATHFGTSGTIQLAAGDYLSANILLGTISFDGNDNWCVTYLG